MSWIWNVLLSFSDEEYWEDGAEEALESCPALDSINSWLQSDKMRNYGPLTSLTECATGNGTGMSANVWGGGFNHFDMEEFIAVVERQQWRDRASVQLFIQGEEDSKFTLIELDEPPEPEGEE
jgi:hypothetical protein